jgi:hypothetical protein
MLKFFKLSSMAALLILAVFTTSCSEDEVTPETRAQAYGTYSYTAEIFALIDGELFQTEADIVNGTIKVEANTTDTDAINFMEDGELSFKGTKIEAAGNGFAFDIPSQTFDGMTISGYEGIELGAATYHGAYSSNNSKIECYFQTTIEGQVFVFEFIATKL